MSKEETKLGVCPLCGRNRDIPGIGIAHLCRPVSHSPIRGIKLEAKRPVKLKGKVVEVEEFSPAIMDATALVVKAIRARKQPVEPAPVAKQLQKAADAVPAKKRGRPKKAEGFDRAEYMRKYKADKRAAAKEGK